MLRGDRPPDAESYRDSCQNAQLSARLTQGSDSLSFVSVCRNAMAEDPEFSGRAGRVFVLRLPKSYSRGSPTDPGKEQNTCGTHSLLENASKTHRKHIGNVSKTYPKRIRNVSETYQTEFRQQGLSFSLGPGKKFYTSSGRWKVLSVQAVTVAGAGTSGSAALIVSSVATAGGATSGQSKTCCL